MEAGIVAKVAVYPKFMNLDCTESQTDSKDLNPIDHYRRDLNAPFTNTVIELYDPAAYEESNSESSAEEKDTIDKGELIYLLVWLGKDRGHKPIQGLTTSDKREVAKRFLQENLLPSSYQEELEELIAQKIRN